MSEMKSAASAFDDMIFLEVDSLKPSPTNPRKEFDEVAQAELVESIESVGVAQSLTVRPEGDGFYEIVAGERRWRAAKEAGLSMVPCRVRDLRDDEVLALQMIENLQRVDLNPVEEFEGMGELRKLNLEPAEISVVLGKSERWVQSRLELGELPAAGREAVRDGRLKMAAVSSVVDVDEDEREGFVQEILEMGEVLSPAQVSEMVRERYRVPRENRKRWRTWWAANEDEDDFEGCEPVEDPELWAEYVRPFGVGVGSWKLFRDPVGGLAAERKDEGVTWGDLALAHGVRGVVVPVGGVRDGEIVAVRVVDRSLIEAAERGARTNGGEFTLGPRKARVVEDDELEEGEDTKAEGLRLKDEGGGVKVEEGAFGLWFGGGSFEVEVEFEDEHLARFALVREVLNQEVPGWGESWIWAMGWSAAVKEENGFLAWYVLRGLSPADLRGRRIAVALGVFEFWTERVLG